MKSRKFTVRESLLLLVLVILLLVFAYFKLVAQPVSQTVAYAQMRQQEAEDEIMLEQAKAIHMQEMEQSLEQIQSDSHIKRIPEYDNMKQVVSFLYSILTGTEKYNLTFNPVTVEGNIASRTIQMSFVCDSYQTAKSIIHQLHNAPYRNEISEVTLQAMNSKENSGEEMEPDLRSVSVKASITFFEYTDSPNEDTK